MSRSSPSRDREGVNFARHVSWLQERTAGMFVSDADGAMVTDSGLPSDTFNVVCHSRADVRIDRVLAHFETVRRPFSWWVGPEDLPVDLSALLEEAGLHAAESELAMSLELHTLADVRVPEPLRIERVRTREQLADFARIAAPADPAAVAFYAQTAAAALTSDCPLRFYLGYADDQAVASSEVTLTGTIAGVYNVSTLPEHRRRGFGTAMTAAPLLEARRDGATLAILQATPAGASIYRRIGFRSNGEITEYKL